MALSVVDEASLALDNWVWSDSGNSSIGASAGGAFKFRRKQMTKPVPEGYRNVNVILTVDGAAKAIDFYKNAFGAEEISRLPMGDKIGHAELQIGDTRIMLNDEFPDHGNLGPNARGGTPVSLIIYTSDVDFGVPQGDRRRRHRVDGGRGSFLGRPDGHGDGSVRPQVEHCHSCRRCASRAVRGAHGRGGATQRDRNGLTFRRRGGETSRLRR